MTKSSAARNLLSSIVALYAFAKEVEKMGEVEEEVKKQRKVLEDLSEMISEAKKDLKEAKDRQAEAEKKTGVAERAAKTAMAEADKVLVDARQTASAMIADAERRVKELDEQITRESTRAKAARNEAARAA